MTESGDYKRILARLGYYDYQQGLIYRNMNQKGGWEAHLANSRSFILEEIAYSKPSKITVLGSGWLLDLPLAELVEMVNEIILIDIVHPPQVREQTAGFPNVRLIEDDVSGGLIAEVWKKAGRGVFFKKRDTLKDISVPVYKLYDPGTVISLNILTQLEVLPVRLLEKRREINADSIMAFRKKIQNNHIETLKEHHSLLIADVKEIFTYSDGTVAKDNTMVADVPGETVVRRWRWDFDMEGVDYHKKKSYMDVIACKW